MMALEDLQRLLRAGVSAGALACCLTACATPPVRETPSPIPSQAPPTEVYFYPTAGQDAVQQDRDRYECYRWAVKQTGYDPSLPQLAPHQRVVVRPVPPPGTDTAAGAVTGGVLGAIVSAPGHAGGGAVIGAAAGAVLGGISDSARRAQADEVQRHDDRTDRERYAALERQAADYRRAMTACLEGRGYQVQ